MPKQRAGTCSKHLRKEKTVKLQRAASAMRTSLTALTLGILLSSSSLMPPAQLHAATIYPTTTPIKNLVVIYGENISFDHYFGTYPNAANTGAAGEPSFMARAGTPSVNGIAAPSVTGGALQGFYASNNPSINLAGTGTVGPVRLSRAQATTCDMDHNYTDEQIAYHSGQVDNFVRAVGAIPSGAGAAQQNCAADQSTVLGYFDTAIRCRAIGITRSISRSTTISTARLTARLRSAMSI
jgi:phospholipase C